MALVVGDDMEECQPLVEKVEQRCEQSTSTFFQRSRRALPFVVLLAVVFGVYSVTTPLQQHASPQHEDPVAVPGQELFELSDTSFAPTESTDSPDTSFAPTEPPTTTPLVQSATTILGQIVLVTKAPVDPDSFAGSPGAQLAVRQTIAEVAGVPVSQVTLQMPLKTDGQDVVANYQLGVPLDQDGNVVAEQIKSTDPAQVTVILQEKLKDDAENKEFETTTVKSLTARLATGGQELCEGHSYDESACFAMGSCCSWNDSPPFCKSAVGSKPCEGYTTIPWLGKDGQCVEVAGASTAGGTNIQACDCVPEDADPDAVPPPNRQWFTGPKGGVGLIRWAAHTGLCLTVDEGSTNIILDQCDGNPNQQFMVVGSKAASQIKWRAQREKCLGGLTMAPSCFNIELFDCEPDNKFLQFSGLEVYVTTTTTTITTTGTPLTTGQPLTTITSTTGATQPPTPNPCDTTQPPTPNPCETTEPCAT